MNASIGQRLGDFEGSAVLGRSGMGELRPAEANKLGREVELKLMPGEIAEGPERLGIVFGFLIELGPMVEKAAR